MTKQTKEIKQYYTEDKLNKGYSIAESELKTDQPKSDLKKFEYLLPPIDVISQYEEIYPGTLEKVLKLAEKEQEKRFQIEKLIIAAEERSRRAGKFFGLLSLTVISAATYEISLKDSTMATLFCAIAFTSVFAISLFSYFSSMPSLKSARPVKFASPEKNSTENSNIASKPKSDKKKFFKRSRNRRY